MKLFFLVLGIFCLHSLTCTGQILFGIHFNLSQPLKEYNANLYKRPMGISLDLMHQTKKLAHFYVGGEVGVSMYANEEFNVEINEGDLAGEVFEVSEEDCFVRYQLLARYIAFRDNWFHPYVEAQLGGLSFFSSSHADDKYSNYFKSNTTFHGTALNLAAGGGVLIKTNSCVSFDFSVLANRGTRTFYRSVAPGGEQARRALDDGRKESATHHLNYQAGVVFNY